MPPRDPALCKGAPRILGPDRAALAVRIAHLAGDGCTDRAIAAHLRITTNQVVVIRRENQIPAGRVVREQVVLSDGEAYAR